MGKQRFPVTAAIRVLRAANATFEPVVYDYVERGGTTASSSALGVAEHSVIKTLVMADEVGEPLVVLMHGDRSVATGRLAKAAGVKKVTPLAPKLAEKFSGYRVGGTSPFGLKRSMPIYAEATIAHLEQLHVNGGKRGFLVRMTGAELVRVLSPVLVEVSDVRAHP